MSASSEIILSNQVHPGDSSIETVTGEKFRGDGYYGRSDGFHTVQINLSGYIGTIEIQATLAIDPADTDWFTVYSQEYITVGDEGTSDSILTNFTGNYVWIRALATNWTDGSISNILLNH